MKVTENREFYSGHEEEERRWEDEFFAPQSSLPNPQGRMSDKEKYKIYI